MLIPPALSLLVVPTYVGVIQISQRELSKISGGPHVCGGDPPIVKEAYTWLGWSPRMWG